MKYQEFYCRECEASTEHVRTYDVDDIGKEYPEWCCEECGEQL